jgi:hypothetical protein
VSSGKCYPTYGQFATEVYNAVSHFQAVNDGIILVELPPAIPYPGYQLHDSVVRPGHPAIAYVEGGYNNDATPYAEHEISEAITDPRARFEGGETWVDQCGCEIADKCGGTSLSVGESPTSDHDVVTLWSNTANAGAGACVYSYMTREDFYFVGTSLTLKHTQSLVLGVPFDDYGAPPR